MQQAPRILQGALENARRESTRGLHREATPKMFCLVFYLTSRPVVSSPPQGGQSSLAYCRNRDIRCKEIAGGWSERYCGHEGFLSALRREKGPKLTTLPSRHSTH